MAVELMGWRGAYYCSELMVKLHISSVLTSVEDWGKDAIGSRDQIALAPSAVWTNNL